MGKDYEIKVGTALYNGGELVWVVTFVTADNYYAMIQGKNEKDIVCCETLMEWIEQKRYSVGFTTHERLYSQKEVENAVLLAADMYKEIYDKSDGWGDTVEKITSLAVQFEEELNWQEDDERDYIEELMKFEDKISKNI